MIASKLILFFCFCLLLDNSIGKIKKSPLERGKYKRLFEQAFKFGKTYGGKLRELGSQWDDLVDEIDQANRKVGFGVGELARFNEASREVSLAQEDVDYYEDLYSKTPTRENKEKLDAAKETHSLKVEYSIALRSHDIIVDRNHIKDLEDKKDHVAIEMIARFDQLRRNLQKKNVRKKIKEAKENGLTDSDIKKILFAEFFRRHDVPQKGGGDATADALLSSFLAGLKSLVDETYYAKLSIIEYVNEEGDDGAPEGDDGAPEGDDGAPEGDDGAPEGDDGAPEGDDGAPEGDDGDSEKDGNAPEKDSDAPEEDDDDSQVPSGASDDGPPDGEQENDDDLREDELLKEFQGLDDPVEVFEAKIFHTEDESGNTKSHLIPELDSETSQLATLALNLNLEDTMKKLINSEEYLNALRSNQIYAPYEDDDLLQDPSNLSIAERLDFYNRRIERLEELLPKVTYGFTADQRLQLNVFPQYKLARENAIYYGRYLVEDQSFFDLDSVPKRPATLPEFNQFDSDEKIRYLLSKQRWARLHKIGSRYTQTIDGYAELIEIWKGLLKSNEDALLEEQSKIRL